MTAQNLLDRYTGAVNERDSHMENNKAVFDKHKQIVMRIIDAENDLRDAVAEEKAGCSNGTFMVSYVPQTQTWADIEVLDRLVAEGSIKKEHRDAIVKTAIRSPRITIGKA